MGYQLAQMLAPMPPPGLTSVKTLQGGRLAIRFICSAEFANGERINLPDGLELRSIQFTSTLNRLDHVQQVSIRLEPEFQWNRVQ